MIRKLYTLYFGIRDLKLTGLSPPTSVWQIALQKEWKAFPGFLRGVNEFWWFCNKHLTFMRIQITHCEVLTGCWHLIDF